VHDPRDLLGLAEPAERDLPDDLLQHLGRDVLEHLGGDEAGVTVLMVRPTPSGSASRPACPSRKAASRARVLVRPNRPDFDAA